MDNGKKSRITVLTTDDIRENARNWTLAGDVGLLAHLEQFSERIISKTQETQKNFNQLVDDFEELHTKVGNVTNQFLALQNCQFVENRVYDEETPTEEKPQAKVQNESDQEKLLLTQYKEAVEVGIKLLDTHFHEVQLPPNSDSDDEDEVSSGNSIIWKPKNPYVSKKFPYLIGSAEWWADDHVGLRPNEENLDTDKIVSESESDVESLKSFEKSTKLSSSSSMENVKSIPIKPSVLESTEDLFGFDRKENSKMMASENASKSSESPSESSAHFLPDFDREIHTKQAEEKQEKPREGELPVTKPKKVDNEFTRELMTKLSSVTGKVPGKKEEVEEESKGKEDKKEVKEKVVVGAPPIKTGVSSMFDETDDGGDLFSGKLVKVAEGKKELFLAADPEDDLFKGENDLFSGGGLFESDTFKKKPDNSSGRRIESEPSAKKEEAEKKEKEVTSPKKNLVKDLFDDLDDDDTLFAPKSNLPTMVKEESGKKKHLNFGRGDEDGLFDGVNTRNEDDFFTSDGLFDTKVNNKLTESSNRVKVTERDSLFDEPEIKPETKKETEKQTENPPVVATATATATNPANDPFGFSSSKEFKKLSILDTDDEEEDDLFATKLHEEKKPLKGKSKTEEENDADDADDDAAAAAAAALFGEKPKPPDSVSVSSSRSSLFDDASVSKSRLASVFEKDNPEKDSLFAGVDKPGRDLFTSKKGKNSLFEDFEDESDDLFGTRKDKHDFGDDLFKSPVRNVKSDILRPTRETLFPDEGSDLFAVTQTPTKPKPPNSLSIKGAESKGGSVGKLNIPGNLKVKLESVAKHISPGARPEVKKKAEEEEEDDEEEEEKEKEKDERKNKKGEKVEEDALDESLQPSTLLKCPSKDRVKIPGRRRPQSRRARQEAIRSSVWDEPGPSEKSNEISNEKSNDLSKNTAPSPAASNPLSPSTDEEDFFKVPELDTNFEKEDQSIFKSDLLQKSKLEENLLFDGAPVLSPLTPKKEEKTPKETKKISIFDDDDDDDEEDEDEDGKEEEEEEENLFKTPKSGLLFQGKREERIKKPLFDPEEDDEDLFGGKKTVAATTKPVEKRKLKEGGEQPQKEKGSFVDPLGLMSGE